MSPNTTNPHKSQTAPKIPTGADDRKVRRAAELVELAWRNPVPNSGPSTSAFWRAESSAGVKRKAAITSDCQRPAKRRVEFSSSSSVSPVPFPAPITEKPVQPATTAQTAEEFEMDNWDPHRLVIDEDLYVDPKKLFFSPERYPARPEYHSGRKLPNTHRHIPMGLEEEEEEEDDCFSDFSVEL